jgi:hypothetical protein
VNIPIAAGQATWSSAATFAAGLQALHGNSKCHCQGRAAVAPGVSVADQPLSTPPPATSSENQGDGVAAECWSDGVRVPQAGGTALLAARLAQPSACRGRVRHGRAETAVRRHARQGCRSHGGRGIGLPLPRV